VKSPSGQTSLEIRDARLFTGRAVMIVCAFGLLLVIPVVGAMLVVSSLQLGFWTALIPLLTICAATLFLPFGFGNTYVTRLVGNLKAARTNDANSFIVQITFIPRIRSGLRAILEDADDIGVIILSGSELVFEGDSVHFSIPYSQLAGVRLETIGLRGLFVYPCVAASVSGLTGLTSFKIADRAGCFLPASRKRTRNLYRRLLAGLKI
jgi:hypothetical protein